jgi:hypothetical protein
MKTRIIYLYTIFILLSSAIFAQNSPSFLLDKMSQSFDNISFRVEYQDYYTNEYIDFFQEKCNEFLKNNGQSKEEGKSKDTFIPSPYKHQIQDWVTDNAGRSIVTMKIAEYLDVSGQIVSQQEKISSYSWDGERAFMYLDHPDKTDYGSIEQEPTAFITQQRKPQTLFTGSFVKILQKALDEKKDIHISSKKDLTKVEIIDSNKKYVALIAPDQGYSCLSEEFYKDDKIVYERLAQYKSIDNAMWFPVSGEIIHYFPNGHEKYRTSVEVSNIKLNKEDINKSSFQIKFPDGTYVEDKILSIGYKQGDATSKRLLDSGSVSSDIIDSEELKDLPNRKETSFLTVFLPDANIAISKKSPFLYSLQERKFSNFEKGLTRFDNEDFIKSIKPGYIAWNGKLVLFNNTKIESPLPTNIKMQEYTYYCELEIPDSVPLPFSLTIKVDKEINYCLSLTEIRDDGIFFTWKTLSR